MAGNELKLFCCYTRITSVGLVRALIAVDAAAEIGGGDDPRASIINIVIFSQPIAAGDAALKMLLASELC